MHHHSVNQKILCYLDQILQSQTPQCLETLTSLATIVISACMLYVTINLNKKDKKFQKKLHTHTSQLALREKYIEIYSVFGKSSLCLNYDTAIGFLPFSFRIEYTQKFTDKIIQQREDIKLLTDLSKLVFKNDLPLLTVLEKIADEFESISAEVLRVFYAELAQTDEKTKKLQIDFPEQFSPDKDSYRAFMENDKLKSEMEKLFSSKDLDSVGERIDNFKKLFDYDNFDKHFAKYFDLDIK